MAEPDPPTDTPTVAPTDAPTDAPTARLTILPGGWQVPVVPGQTLLRAALAAGVRLPSSCRNGTCRACLCRLAEGAVDYAVEWPGLLAEEKRDGALLPCVALPRGDVTIEAPAATPLFG